MITVTPPALHTPAPSPAAQPPVADAAAEAPGRFSRLLDQASQRRSAQAENTPDSAPVKPPGDKTDSCGTAATAEAPATVATAAAETDAGTATEAPGNNEAAADETKLPTADATTALLAGLAASPRPVPAPASGSALAKPARVEADDPSLSGASLSGNPTRGAATERAPAHGAPQWATALEAATRRDSPADPRADTHADTGADTRAEASAAPRGDGTSAAAPGVPAPGAAFVLPPPVAANLAAAPAAGRLGATPGTPEFASQLGTQLSTFIQDGVHHARLELHPVEMGPLTVQIQLDGQTAQVHLAAENVQTRQALEQAMPLLAGSLREAGLTLSGGGVFEQPRQARPDPGVAMARGERSLDGGGPQAPVTGPTRRRGVVDLVA